MTWATWRSAIPLTDKILPAGDHILDLQVAQVTPYLLLELLAEGDRPAELMVI